MRLLIFNRKVLYFALCLTVIICMIAALVVINQPQFTDTLDSGSASENATTSSDTEGTASNIGSVDNTASTTSSVHQETDGEMWVSTEELADLIIEDMSLEQKIYQMFIVSPETVSGTECVFVADSALLHGMQKYPVGGFIYFADNLRSPTQTLAMLSATQGFADQTQTIPMFLCVDEEGGRVARIGNNPDFRVDAVPPMAEIDSEKEAYNAGDTIGKYLSKLGFNVNFAPDADVLTNKHSPIGDRSFGSDTNTVVKYALQYAKGLKNNKVLATYKHFPGHGATLGDSHDGFAEITRGLDELRDNEFMPFASASQNKIDFVMTGHIAIPEIDDDIPASLSKKIVTDMLKGELGFNGIIVTDALNMGAITKYYDADEAVIMAINAGNDMILCPAFNPEDLESIMKSVLDAVESGEISEQQINASVKKIVTKKLIMQQEG